MATERMQSSNAEEHGFASDKDTLYMLAGVALIVFGTGLVLSNPVVRRFMGQMGVGNLLQAAMPDVERYWKMRNM